MRGRTTRLFLAAAASVVLVAAGASATNASAASNLTVEAQGPGGAVVTFVVTATDRHGRVVTLVCEPPSGSLFPLGRTTVTCTDPDGGDEIEAEFTVTVVDTTPPTLAAHEDVSVETTNPLGAEVAFTAPTASDLVDPAPDVSCVPASGSFFPLGSTTVECSAKDDAGNTATSSFVVGVRLAPDTTPPILSPHPDVAAEATSAAGAEVSYVFPTATDAVDPDPSVSCAPASGARFPLGASAVHCTATDAAGNAATSSFAVIVGDATPPVLSSHADIGVQGSGAAGAVVSYANPTAFDTVDGVLPVSCAPASGSLFPLGRTNVSCSATDAHGNVGHLSFAITVADRPNVSDRFPPGDVTRAAAKAGNGIVRLFWAAPADADFDHVAVTRSSALDRATLVYSGNRTKYEDRRLLNGVRYRYRIVSYDHAGNASKGVAVRALPRTLALLQPKAAAILRAGSPPLLRWRKVPGATYYNVQLYRGTEKVFTAWPTPAHLQVPREWRYGGRRQTLAAGVYRWYVWPGFGTRFQRRYGTMLGQSAFTVR